MMPAAPRELTDAEKARCSKLAAACASRLSDMHMCDAVEQAMREGIAIGRAEAASPPTSVRCHTDEGYRAGVDRHRAAGGYCDTVAAFPEPQATVSVSAPDGMRELPTAHQWAHDLAEANEPNERIWFAASLLRQLVDEYRACEAQHTEDARVFDALLLLRDAVVFTRAGLPDEDAMRRAIDTANAAIAARSTGGGNG